MGARHDSTGTGTARKSVPRGSRPAGADAIVGTMDTGPAADFWRFALATHALPGVERALLAAQDRHGATVMLLLYLCWCATRGVQLGEHEIAAARQRGWLLEEHLVGPLRAARRALRGAARSFGIPALTNAAQRVLDAEIESESLQAAQLAAGAQPPAPGGGAVGRPFAIASLGIYLEMLGIDRSTARTLAVDMADAVFARA